MYIFYNLLITFLISFTPIIFLLKYCNDVDSKIIYLVIYLFHFLIFYFVIFFYINNYPADTNGYLDYAFNFSYKKLTWQKMSTGTSFVMVVTHFFYNKLNFSLFNIYLFFSTIGILNFFLFAKILNFEQKKNNLKKIIYFLILLLPSMHFFNSLVGKDVLFFTLTIILIYSLQDINNRKFLLFFSILSAFLIRPHVGLIIFVSLTPFLFLKFILDRNHSILKKILFFIIITIIGQMVFLRFFDSNIYEIFKILKFVEETLKDRIGVWQISDSGFYLPDLNFFQIIFNYLFGPSIFSAKNFFEILISFENLILILILFMMLTFIKFRKISKSEIFEIIPLSLYSVIFLIIMSYATPIQGIVIRQKWMILPIIIYILSFLDLKTNREK